MRSVNSNGAICFCQRADPIRKQLRDEIESTKQVSANESGKDGAKQPCDGTPVDHDVPPFNLGGQDMFAISPDGQELAYTSNIESEAGPAFIEATSTNNEIFIVPINEGQVENSRYSREENFKKSRQRFDAALFPKWEIIAWRSQARAGFESDKFSLVVYDRAATKLTI